LFSFATAAAATALALSRIHLAAAVTKQIIATNIALVLLVRIVAYSATQYFAPVEARKIHQTSFEQRGDDGDDEQNCWPQVRQLKYIPIGGEAGVVSLKLGKAKTKARKTDTWAGSIFFVNQINKWL